MPMPPADLQVVGDQTAVPVEENDPAQPPAPVVTSASPLPATATATPAPQAADARTPAGPTVRGVTDSEILFGMAAAFSSPAKELGRQMKLGVESAFSVINAAGGINGRQLRLVAANDGLRAQPNR
jgi:branched-chain amino acid transport system substrate-binding protein